MPNDRHLHQNEPALVTIQWNERIQQLGFSSTPWPSHGTSLTSSRGCTISLIWFISSSSLLPAFFLFISDHRLYFWNWWNRDVFKNNNRRCMDFIMDRWKILDSNLISREIDSLLYSFRKFESWNQTSLIIYEENSINSSYTEL